MSDLGIVGAHSQEGLLLYTQETLISSNLKVMSQLLVYKDHIKRAVKALLRGDWHAVLSH